MGVCVRVSWPKGHRPHRSAFELANGNAVRRRARADPKTMRMPVGRVNAAPIARLLCAVPAFTPVTTPRARRPSVSASGGSGRVLEADHLDIIIC